MDRKYFVTLTGAAAVALAGAILLENGQTGAMLGAVIGAGYCFAFCLLREGSA